MRIHSNTLTHNAIWRATNGLSGVYATVTEHGSHSHARAFEVSLEGNGYRKNTGTSGAGEEIGATWDEWGVFLARLFEIDPHALCGSVKNPVYKDAASFHYRTGTRFADLDMPEDTHKRHNWHYDGPGAGSWSCTKCTATKRYEY